MKKENKEMIAALRKFVIDTANNAHTATPAELEAMVEAAWIVLEDAS